MSNIGHEIKRHEIVPEKIPIPVKEPTHEPAVPQSFQVRPGFNPVKVMQLEEDYGVPVTFAEDLDREREVQRVSPFMQQLVNPFAQAYGVQITNGVTTFTVPSTAKSVTFHADGTVTWVE